MKRWLEGVLCALGMFLVFVITAWALAWLFHWLPWPPRG